MCTSKIQFSKKWQNQDFLIFSLNFKKMSTRMREEPKISCFSHIWILQEKGKWKSSLKFTIWSYERQGIEMSGNFFVSEKASIFEGTKKVHFSKPITSLGSLIFGWKISININIQTSKLLFKEKTLKKLGYSSLKQTLVTEPNRRTPCILGLTDITSSDHLVSHGENYSPIILKFAVFSKKSNENQVFWKTCLAKKLNFLVLEKSYL